MKSILKTVVLFFVGILTIRLFRELMIDRFSTKDFYTFEVEYYVKSFFKGLNVFFAYFLMKRFNLFNLGGLGKYKLSNWYLLLFPLYIVLLNIPDSGEVAYDQISITTYMALAVYTLSVGFSEEYLFRSFLQSFFIRMSNLSKRQVFYGVLGAAILFGLLHLLKFNKGLYGELTQVLYGTFIGVMFGPLLLRTHKIWPLVIIHALIDFVAKLDDIIPVSETVENSGGQMNFQGLLITTLIMLPCLIYGLVLLRKVQPEQLEEKIAKG